MSRYLNKNVLLGLVVLIAGVLILASTWMAWSGPATGANFASNPSIPGINGNNNFWVFAGHQFLVLSGLWTLILGALIIAAAFGVAYGIRGSRGIVSMLLLVTFVVSLINLTAIAGIGLGIGAGPIVLLIFSVLGGLAVLGSYAPAMLRAGKPVEVEEAKTEPYARPKPGMAMR